MNVFNEFSFLQHLRFIRLRISFEALGTIVLPEYKGSAWRGCLGETLRNEVCQDPGPGCEKCRDRFDCPFSQLFNSFVDPAHPHSRKYPKCPHPYIIDPVGDKRLEIKPGENFGFDLTITGDADRHLPLLLRAFRLMGETGIGKGRVPFKAVGLSSLQNGNKYAPLLYFGQPGSLSLENIPVKTVKDRVVLKFETPFRIKENGKLLLSPPGFTYFTQRLALRLGLLAHFHCGAPWPGEGMKLPAGAESIHIGSSDVKMVDWQRYSGTQDTKMNFDGLTGSITYQGEGLNGWMPLLAMGSWLHAGSTATFGLGKYTLTA